MGNGEVDQRQLTRHGHQGLRDVANGVELWDRDGGRYLDFLAGNGSLNYGHNNPILKQALINHMVRSPIVHCADFPPRAEADFLAVMHNCILRPRRLDLEVRYTGSTRVDAVQSALQLARDVTHRTDIISFTSGSRAQRSKVRAAADTQPSTAERDAGLSSSDIHVDILLDHPVFSLEGIESILDEERFENDKPAAIVVETVAIQRGLQVASNQTLQRLETLCRDFGVLLIIDDSRAGCGCTGTFFSFEESGICPDIVILADSLSGYGLPLSATLMRKTLKHNLSEEQAVTIRSNDHALATATAALRNYWQSDDFSESIQKKGRYLEAKLQQLLILFPDDLIEIRGRGVVRAVVSSDAELAFQITRSAFDNGLILEQSAIECEVIKLRIPFTTTFAQLDEGVMLFRKAIEEGLRRSKKTRQAS